MQFYKWKKYACLLSGNFSLLLDKEMEIYVTCILQIMKWLRLRYPNQQLSHIKEHKRLTEAELVCQ